MYSILNHIDFLLLLLLDFEKKQLRIFVSSTISKSKTIGVIMKRYYTMSIGDLLAILLFIAFCIIFVVLLRKDLQEQQDILKEKQQEDTL